MSTLNFRRKVLVTHHTRLLVGTAETAIIEEVFVKPFCHTNQGNVSQTNPEMLLGPCLLCSQDVTVPPPDNLALPVLIQLFYFVNWSLTAQAREFRGIFSDNPTVITEAWCANDEPLISPRESPASDSTATQGLHLPNMIKCLSYRELLILSSLLMNGSEFRT